MNWLAFLNKYKLHGILCDDMGLGKTLQSICILAGDHYARDFRYQETKSPDSSPLPSLVICPPTLIGKRRINYSQLSPILNLAGAREALNKVAPTHCVRHEIQ